ncbi:hypothetical protein RBY4I_3693 [Rhodobacterales bacterium Y4I]|nr:hypothetical protein RBY4I_3693 [Rhodobacterales bacterium Y4I]
MNMSMGKPAEMNWRSRFLSTAVNQGVTWRQKCKPSIRTRAGSSSAMPACPKARTGWRRRTAGLPVRWN